ncbi:MAG: TonB-dependent receptor [Terriglobia bacterium]
MLSKFTRLLVGTLCGLGLIFLSAPQNCRAQVLYGSIAGTVADQSGAVVPGATVTIINESTHFTRSTTTGSAGDYRVIDLPAGTYTVTVAAKGFRTVSRTGVPVSVGSVSDQNIQLSLGAVTQAITVSGATATLQTQTTDVHTTLTNYAIQNLPENVYHNFQSIELLTPGVVSMSGLTNSYPNSIADAPDRSFDINTNGLSTHMNTSRVDGATDQFLWLPDHMVVMPPTASVEEVNVQTADFNVQKGLTAGAATDVITKSGTNQFHGQLYGYFTNQALDAQNSFVHIAGSKPQYLVNNDGVAIGGPIKHNKLFFFGNWDGYYQREEASDINLIPPTDMRQGNFNSYLGAPLYNQDGTPATVCTTEGATTPLREGMVFDPTTGNQTTGQGRCVFSSGGQLNVIPANRIYQGSANFWQLMAPYVPNDTGGAAFNQFTATNDLRLRKSDWNRNVYTGKVDWNISQKQLLWVKYTAQKAFLNDGSDYGIAGQGGGTGLTHDLAQMVTLGHSYTLRPDMVLSGHVGFTRMGEHNQLFDFGKEYGQTVLGLVNSNTPSNDPRYSGMPGVNISDFTTLGTDQSWEPVWRNDWQLTLDENATLIKGKHDIVFGVDANHNHMNHWQPEIDCCARGELNTSDDNTFDDFDGLGTPATFYTAGGAATGTAVTPSSAPWNGAAEFDLGLGNAMDNTQQFIKATNKDWQEALYVGDTFRATSKFTVNAGLRWEYYPLITRDGESKFEVYDAATNTLKLGGLGGNPTHLGVTSSKKLFAPRLGLAYQLRDRTVIRAAYGIEYDTLPLERPLRGFYPYTIGAANSLPSSLTNNFLPYATYNAATNTANAIPGLFDGVPLITAPAGLASGTITPPGTYTVGTLAPGPFKRGYVQTWNFTVEQKLPGNMLLSAGYVGNHLAHQLNGEEANAGIIGGGAAGQPLFANFGRISDTYLFQGYLDSHYNSLQVSLSRHMTNGLYFQGAYTYSKVIGYMDDEGWEDGLRFQCPSSPLLPQGCQSLNRHTLSYDHTHVLTLGYLYTLPFGAGHKWASNNRAASAILGGWQTNGILTIMSGVPLELTQSGGSVLNAPFTGQVPNFAGGLQMIKGTGRGQQWFNTSAFVPDLTETIGNSGHGDSWLRGPGLAQLDFNLFRNFKLTERFTLRGQVEMQNLTNTPHWNSPSQSCTNVNGVCGGSFGQITGGFGQRIVQLGLQLMF